MCNFSKLNYAVTKRFVLHTGYGCNLRCKFCYYLDDLNQGTTKNFSTKQLHTRIKVARWLGKNAIDFSGGEPTIRKDLPSLINFCKQQSYQDICIITNGQRSHDLNFCYELKNGGLTEGLFSLHGHNADIHDDLTGSKQSFNRVLQSLDNFATLGLTIRINTVVNNHNYQFLDDFFKTIKDYKAFTVNLLVFNPAETTVKIDRSDSTIRFSDYKIIGDAISSSLDRWKSSFEFINVRFLPFCFLKKHPETIKTQWQKFHEDQEWDPILTIGLQKGFTAVAASAIAGLFYCQHNVPKYRSANYWTTLNRLVSAFRIRKYSYKQNKICKKKCALSPICTGLQKDFVTQFGFPDFAPISIGKKGEKIFDPLHFMHEQTRIVKSLKNNS